MLEKLFESILSGTETVLKSGFELAEAAITGIPSKKQGYKSEFASPGKILSSGNYGFRLTGNKSLSVKDSYQNSMIVGGTGTGKSSVVLLPSLYSMKSSFVVHDPSGELHSKSSGYLKEKGYEIKVLNFSNPGSSSNYNPLTRARNSSEIQKIASMLVQNSIGGQKSDKFWENLAISLLSTLIQILKTQPEEFQNLYNVRHLLNNLGGNHESVDALFSKHADNKLFSEYKSFIAYDEKVTSGVIATCKAALQVFNDELIASVTSSDNIRFEDFRKKPTVLYIQNSVADQKYYSTLTSIFFEQFFSFVLSRFPEEKEHDIFFLIDECSSLHLPTLPLATANVRKHRAGIMLIIQDFNQLVHHYGKYESDAIRANCFAKMYFTGQSLETSREISEMLGKFEYKDKDGKKQIRELMTRDEIRTMKIKQALIICGHHAPVLAKLQPYYESRIYRLYSEFPAPQIQTNPDTVPVLPLNSNNEE